MDQHMRQRPTVNPCTWRRVCAQPAAFNAQPAAFYPHASPGYAFNLCVLYAALVFPCIESTAKRACHHSGAAFTEEDAERVAPTQRIHFVVEVLCALGVSAVRFCSEVMNLHR